MIAIDMLANCSLKWIYLTMKSFVSVKLIFEYNNMAGKQQQFLISLGTLGTDYPVYAFVNTTYQWWKSSGQRMLKVQSSNFCDGLSSPILV